MRQVAALIQAPTPLCRHVRRPERRQARVRVDEVVHGGHEPRVVRDGREPVQERDHRLQELLLLLHVGREAAGGCIEE